MAKLFLLKQDFLDPARDNGDKLYYCPQCAIIEGIIKYYPQLETLIEIYRVDFRKPRAAIAELIGDENQSCPVLIIENTPDSSTDTSYFNSFGDNLFVDTVELIAKYLTEKFEIGILH